MRRGAIVLALFAVLGLTWALASQPEPTPTPQPPEAQAGETDAGLVAPSIPTSAAEAFGRAFCPPERLPRIRSRTRGDDLEAEVLFDDGGVWLAASVPFGPEGEARLDRNEVPVFALAKGLSHLNDPKLDTALDALHAFLAAHDHPAVRALVARLEVARDLRRDDVIVEQHGVTLVAPPTVTEVDRAAWLAKTALFLDEAAQLVGPPARSSLTVVLYPSRSELLAVSCYPMWAGGYFDGNVVLPVDAAPKSLRHEVLHATLGARGRAPIWFEEGAAQAFEGKKPDEKSWRQLLASRTWIPFSSLERSLTDFATADAKLAYAQSHAMVLLLASCGGSDRLTRAARLATGPDPGIENVFSKVCEKPLDGAMLLEFMQRTLDSNDGGAGR